jgi:branched-subunit amino acid aminotransferase/4-amino-4-deoxychorismate lyase
MIKKTLPQNYLPKTSGDQLIDLQVNLFKNRAKDYLLQADYSIFYSHALKKLVAAPPAYALGSKFSHAIDYASGMFEGGSAMVNETTGIPHIILHHQRLDRLFHRSLPSRGYSSPVRKKQLAQAILDLIAINGLDLFKNPDKSSKNPYVRAYIRPTIHPAPLSGYGISMRPDYPIDLAIVSWAWPDYLKPDIYTNGGTSAITGHQRLFKITGKDSSNYGEGVANSKIARNLGTDELIYLAPYLVRENGQQFWADPNDIDKKLKWGALSDGPGEEVFAISKDGKTLVYTPMKANRLGGTVLNYIVTHMAPKLGLKTKEKDITVRDLKGGKYLGVGMMGNAVKVTPMHTIVIFKNDKPIEKIKLFKPGSVPEPLLAVVNRWDQETRGLIKPSHPSLTTPVDLKRGVGIRKKLDQIFF